jgi:hypothetical protein
MTTLLRMVYVSTSTKPIETTVGTVHSDIGRILMQSRKNNPKQHIGGVLYFSNNYFFQCLEGEQEVVNNLYQKISTDPRHKNVQSISVKRIDERKFGDWSMKYVALKDKVTSLLNRKEKTEFNPYKFDDEMIEDMLNLFTSEMDNTTPPDQNYSNDVPKKVKTGFFSKLFG